MTRTGLTWGNLSAHLSKLGEAGYVRIEKDFVEKKPHTMVRLTDGGRKAFEVYRDKMQKMLSTE
jgi:DNA-binding MarR family transcriptional regulator